MRFNIPEKHAPNKEISYSIDWPINQSIGQTINQSINRSIESSKNQKFNLWNDLRFKSRLTNAMTCPTCFHNSKWRVRASQQESATFISRKLSNITSTEITSERSKKIHHVASWRATAATAKANCTNSRTISVQLNSARWLLWCRASLIQLLKWRPSRKCVCSVWTIFSKAERAWKIRRQMRKKGEKTRVNKVRITSINQSINQTIDRTINQPTNQSINLSINYAINQSTNQPIEPTPSHRNKTSNDQSSNQADTCRVVRPPTLVSFGISGSFDLFPVLLALVESTGNNPIRSSFNSYAKAPNQYWQLQKKWGKKSTYDLVHSWKSNMPFTAVAFMTWSRFESVDYQKSAPEKTSFRII